MAYESHCYTIDFLVGLFRNKCHVDTFHSFSTITCDFSAARGQYQTILMVDTERNEMYRQQDHRILGRTLEDVRRTQEARELELQAWTQAEERLRESDQRRSARREERERRRQREISRERRKKCLKIFLFVRIRYALQGDT